MPDSKNSVELGNSGVNADKNLIANQCASYQCIGYRECQGDLVSLFCQKIYTQSSVILYVACYICKIVI